MCNQVFLNLVSQASVQSEAAETKEAPLYEAFGVLWEQFEGDSQQASVCARIVAFHFLMERTRGAVVQAWLMEHPDAPETVVLDDAIVAAIGSAPIAPDGSLLESDFLAAVQSHVQKRSSTAQPEHGIKSYEVALRLLAFEAQTAGLDVKNTTVAFHVLRKLHLCLRAVMGREAFRILLARALALAAREESGLAGIKILEDGTFEGEDGGSPHGGTVLISYLIRLQTTFIGEALLHSLLREIWPGLQL